MTPWPLSRARRNRELDEEIAAHLRLAVADRMARGDTREQAETAARRELGNAGLVKEVTREQWGWASVRLMRSVLYGVGPSDPLTYAAVAALLLAIALAASSIPAGRAHRPGRGAAPGLTSQTSRSKSS